MTSESFIQGIDDLFAMRLGSFELLFRDRKNKVHRMISIAIDRDHDIDILVPFPEPGDRLPGFLDALEVLDFQVEFALVHAESFFVRQLTDGFCLLVNPGVEFLLVSEVLEYFLEHST